MNSSLNDMNKFKMYIADYLRFRMLWIFQMVIMFTIYDQTKMREHLIACFEQQKITTSLLYEKKNTEKVVTYKETSP